MYALKTSVHCLALLLLSYSAQIWADQVLQQQVAEYSVTQAMSLVAPLVLFTGAASLLTLDTVRLTLSTRSQLLRNQCSELDRFQNSLWLQRSPYLAHRDQLNLDGDVRSYLSELRDYGVTVTIRQMVHHISGMGGYVLLTPNETLR